MRRLASTIFTSPVPPSRGGVKINTTYQFGLGDFDFMLAFETSDFTEFSNLVQRLRETEARPYTQADTPLIPGVKKTASELVDALSL